jgi:murein DD-endopeptidase MepM/ murein hydrolase activator NlpD
MSYKFKLKWHRLIIVAFISALICLGIGGIKPKILQASSVRANTQTTVANNVSAVWQQGSFPVENFQSYTSPFGYRLSPVDGKPQFHNGLDLAAPVGSYVRSWWSGKVTKVSDNTLCGTSLTIESGAWSHTYCHLSGHVEESTKGPYLIDREGGLQILLGQGIPVGARIGRVGMTGRTTGPHLHWTLRYNGNYVDPALVLKEMFKSKASLPNSSHYTALKN